MTEHQRPQRGPHTPTENTGDPGRTTGDPDEETDAGPSADNLPSDKPHQDAEEELNPHFDPTRRPDRSRGD